ncbi:MAG: HicB family protein [Pirellulaceae bacterium]|nr:MAG: HicB family protein [Pirellulaceae bacterium]
MRLKVVFEASDEGGYTVYVPALPGCISEGDSLEEARRNILEAIELYVETDDGDRAQEHGGKEVIVEEVTV